MSYYWYRNANLAKRERRKETKTDKAEKIYRHEQRRYRKEQERISRANGYAVSPPSPFREESISPPRKRPKQRPQDFEEGEDGEGEWMGGYGRRAREEVEKREWEDKMHWMANEVSDPFADWPTFGRAGPSFSHIPERWRPSSPSIPRPPGFGPFPFPPFSNRHVHSTRRNPLDEIDPYGIPIPPLGHMTESEYTNFVRQGMYARRRAEEMFAAERHRREHEAREREKEIEREKRERKEERRRHRREREEYERHRARSSASSSPIPIPHPHTIPYGALDDPTKYFTRWESLQTGGEVESTELLFDDIPWPVFRPSARGRSSGSSESILLDTLTLENVRKFMTAVAGHLSTSKSSSAGGTTGDLRKTVREAIRNFHPDRFYSRVLGRVREKDREKVRQGADQVSRVLNDLVKIV